MAAAASDLDAAARSAAGATGGAAAGERELATGPPPAPLPPQAHTAGGVGPEFLHVSRNIFGSCASPVVRLTPVGVTRIPQTELGRVDCKNTAHSPDRRLPYTTSRPC